MRACGLMDKAPDFGSGDCRFESCHARAFLLHVMIAIFEENKVNFKEKNNLTYDFHNSSF